MEAQPRCPASKHKGEFKSMSPGSELTEQCPLGTLLLDAAKSTSACSRISNGPTLRLPLPVEAELQG